MQVGVSKWGNSLGVRIPREVAEQMGLHAGSRVDVALEGSRIVISRPRPRYRLADLLADVTPDIRDSFDWGPERGRESADG